MELLTNRHVAEQLGRLKAGGLTSLEFKRSPIAVIETYHRELAGVSADAFEAAVTRVLREDEFFPKIARLRTFAREWEARNRATASPVVRDTPVDEGRCQACGERWSDAPRWRPVIGERSRVQCYGDGRVLLEEYRRIHCRCSAPATYEPDPDLDGPPRMWPKPGTELQRRVGLTHAHVAATPAD